MTISEFINDIQRELIELSISEDEVDKSSITNIIFDEKINDQIDTKITTFNGYLNRDFIEKLTGNSVLINMNEFYTNSMTGMISNVNTYIIKGHPITDPDVSAIGLTIFNNYYGLDSRRYSKTIYKRTIVNFFNDYRKIDGRDNKDLKRLLLLNPSVKSQLYIIDILVRKYI